MNGMMRKLLLAGIGAFSLTKEKAEQIVNELVERGQVTREEARGLFRDLIRKGEQEREALQEVVRSELEKLRQDLGFVTRQDIEALAARIENLEKRLSQQ